jgi:transcriptional regulator with XRE-family HTH domain
VEGTLGERLRAIRTRRLLTQKELADLAGLRWQTISEIESGRQQPRFRTIKALAAALEVDASVLAGTEA